MTEVESIVKMCESLDENDIKTIIDYLKGDLGFERATNPTQTGVLDRPDSDADAVPVQTIIIKRL